MVVSQDKPSLRILSICPQFRPIVGGYERAAERLSAALASYGVSVVVIAERRDHTWPVREHVDGYEVRRLSCSYRRHRHVVSSLLSFAEFLLRHGRKFDVWHVHQYGFHAALTVALGKVLHRPVVLKLPSSGAMGIEKAMGSAIAGRILRYVHQQVDACIVVSEQTREEAIHFGIEPEHIYRIPNGVDGGEFYPASPVERCTARRALGLHCERLVLYVGRFSPEKNPVGLLEAWASINARVRDGALLALVGDGPDRARVQAKVQELNLAGSIHLAGQRSDVATWYRAADVYVLPSLLEGLSNTMIEALASGLPVISTRVSGSATIAEPPLAGIVIDVGNTNDLAKALERLLVDKAKRSELGRNARLKFEKHFSLESISRTTVTLYKELLNLPIRETA